MFGLDPWADPVATHRDIAYVPGDVSLWPNLSGGEVIDLLTGLRGGADENLRRELIEEFEFDPRSKARTYSKGNRQKVALIAAFARPARLYLLDEPSAGLDPVMDAVFRRQIRRVSGDGATVLLSSHILSEVEQLCDRVTIIRSGTAVETGTLAELRHLKRTHFRVTGLADPARLAALPGHARDEHRRRRRRVRRGRRRPGCCPGRHRRAGDQRLTSHRRPWSPCSCATTATATAAG